MILVKCGDFEFFEMYGKCFCLIIILLVKIFIIYFKKFKIIMFNWSYIYVYCI